MTAQTLSGYQGWRNYATWNVWLWLNNEQQSYDEMVRYLGSTEAPSYRGLIDQLRIDGIIGRETPDGIFWYSPDLDIDELDEALRETAVDHIRPS